MKKFYTFLVLILCAVFSHAQFSGSYAPSNWSVQQSAGANGSVNTSGAPGNIVIRGSNDPSGNDMSIKYTRYTIVAPRSGVWSFNWSYQSNDSDNDPSYDPAGVMINGGFTQLTADGGSTTQSGTYSGGYVTAGTVIGFSVIANDNTQGDALLTISNFSPPGGVLPLKLISFSGREEANGVQLKWTTASEVNTSHFNIQRSVDGINFTSIGSVPAGLAGGQYSFNDALAPATKKWYRLLMVDQDGQSSYSGIIEMAGSNITALTAYPNPVQRATSIRFSAASAGREEMEVYDVSGRRLQVISIQVAAGNNSQELNLTGFTKGMYYIKLVGAAKTLTIVKD